ncbi:MAG: hypothetical protein GY720_22440 [bacterium]|nr:hypothetical protein [bacterium]
MVGVYEERTFEPGGRDPAPGDLRTVQLFINSHNIEDDLEMFSRPATAARWLFDKGLTTGTRTVRTRADLKRVVTLREALRQMLAANHDSCAPPSSAAATLNDVATDGKLSVAIGSDAGALVVATAGGLAGALARIALIVAEASVTGQWHRLKVCPNDGCQWVFWDSSRNRAGRWCTMSLCGNQSKVRAHRRRASL